MSLSPIEYLRHILDEADFLMKNAKDFEREEFLNDEILKRAAVRSITIIGEAAKKLPVEFREKYAQIEWKAVAGMRDKLIHDYFGIDYEIVWDAIVNKIPDLKREIERIIVDEDSR